MNNFEVFYQYNIPIDVLSKMLKVYKLIGQNEIYLNKLEKHDKILQEQTINKDTFFIAKLAKIDINESRMRSLSIKDTNARNIEEKKYLSIKLVINTIRKEADNLPLSGVELLTYLNRIFGKNTHHFIKKTLSSNDKVDRNKPKISIRLFIEKMFEEYERLISTQSFEALYLSSVAYLEIATNQPYTDHNDIALIFAMLYMLLKCDIIVFKYISIAEYIYQRIDELRKTIALCIINYQERYFNLTPIITFIYDMIIEAYRNLDEIIKNINYDARLQKSDNVLFTIHNLGNTFSKEEIKNINPDISDSTINRVLINLRDLNYIRALSSGRSARWIKLRHIPELEKYLEAEEEKYELE